MRNEEELRPVLAWNRIPSYVEQVAARARQKWDNRSAPQLNLRRDFRKMPDFIQKLAQNIREKDHREMVEKEFQLHHAKVLERGGKNLWEELKRTLNGFINELRDALASPALADDLRFEQAAQQVTIIKGELPCVRATLAFSGQAIDMDYATQNPRCTDPPSTKTIHVQLKVDPQNVVYFELNGLKTSVYDVATHFMTAIFTV